MVLSSGITLPKKGDGSNKSGSDNEHGANEEDDVGGHDGGCDDGGCGAGALFFRDARRNNWGIRLG